MPAVKAVKPAPVPPPRREEPIRQPTPPDIGTDDISFFAKHKTAVTAAGGVVGLLLIALVMRSAFSGSESTATTGRSSSATRRGGGGSSSGVPEGVDAFHGKWRLLTARMQPEPIIPGFSITGSVLSQVVGAAFTGPGSTATLTVDKRSYTLEVDVSGEGQYTATITPDKYKPEARGNGVITMTPQGTAIQNRANVFLSEVDTDMPHIKAKAGDTSLIMQEGTGNSGTSAVFWNRPGGSGQPHRSAVGTWSNELIFVDSYLPYRATLEFHDNGDYRIRFTRTEQGMLEAEDGRYQFKRSIAMGPPVEGRYEFDGPDRFTVTEPRGTATWVRDTD